MVFQFRKNNIKIYNTKHKGHYKTRMPIEQHEQQSGIQLNNNGVTKTTCETSELKNLPTISSQPANKPSNHLLDKQQNTTNKLEKNKTNNKTIKSDCKLIEFMLYTS